MIDWWTKSAWWMTAFFGALSLFQFIRDFIRRKIWIERSRSLMAVRASLFQLRAMLTEAGETGEVIKTDAAKQFCRQIGHQIKSIEHQVDMMLYGDGVKAVENLKSPI